LDIPRIFNITESAHRIHNPITPEKLAILGAALRLEPGTRVLDLGSGSGEMLCTWARDHGISGIGVDLSQLFIAQAKHRAEELGVADRVKFIHGDAAGYVSDEKVSVAACVGATWIGGGVAGTIELLARSLRTGGIILIGEPTGGSYRRRKMSPGGVWPTPSPTFCCFQNFSRLSASLATTSLKWFWLTKTAGTDTRRLNGSLCAAGLKPIPTTSWRRRFEPN
jgi:SAM-dependent methyltransferase